MKQFLSYFNLQNVPLLPLLLGLAGTIPFIFLSLSIWIFSYELKLLAIINLINYSVVILSFIGAIHWGVAMVRNENNYKSYLISIMPALLSWFLLSFMGFIVSLMTIFIILMFLFLGMFFIDVKAVKEKIIPQWYLSLRKIITVIVFLSLGSVTVAINMKVI